MPVQVSPNAHAILEKRYLTNGETVDGMWDRVSGGVSDYRDIMADLIFLPNSPTLFNMGTKSGGTLSACFVFDIEDCLLGDWPGGGLDSPFPSSILGTTFKAACVAKAGGGVGYYFGKIRPEGSPVNSTHRKACGPVQVLHWLHRLRSLITQGGKRDLAQMGILNAAHPDIRKWIHCKDEDPKALESFNISVSWTDEMLKKVEWSSIHCLDERQTAPTEETEIWMEQCQSAWRTGDPGMLFFDAVNRTNATPHLGDINATNPCVTADSWVLTGDGPQQVGDLVGRDFIAVVEGNRYVVRGGFFSTGVKDVFRVKTRHGYQMDCTADHRILGVTRCTRWGMEDGWKSVAELQAGDRVVLADQRESDWKGDGTYDEGWLVGNLLGDGTFQDNTAVLCYWGADKDHMAVYAQGLLQSSVAVRGNFGSARGGEYPRDKRAVKSCGLKDLAHRYGVGSDKKVGVAAEKTSRSFHRGFLRGWFDADGSVQGSQQKGVSVRLSSSSRDNLLAAQRMLSRIGVVSRIYLRREESVRSLPDGLGGRKEYRHDSQWELVISGASLVVFEREVGFACPKKSDRLKCLLSSYVRETNRERRVAVVESVEFVGRVEVYDCTVPGPHEYDCNGLRSHNCGETPNLSNEPCNLGSLAVKRLVKKNDKGKYVVDWDAVKHYSRIATRFLDDILDWNTFPHPDIDHMARHTRKLGLGVMGWADLLALLHVPYDTQDAVDLGTVLMKTIQETATDESRLLADKKGPYPAWDKHKSPAWAERLRNSTRTSIAPTGTIAIIADCMSSIEPHFALEWGRTTNEGIKMKERITVWDQLDGFVPKIANEIDWKWHVKHQAAFQKHTDLGVSKTINLPNSATVQDISGAYRMMWETGCKGGTVYRDGCRSEQVLVSTAKKSVYSMSDDAGPRRRKLPAECDTKRYKFRVGSTKGYVHVGLYEDGTPGEIFVRASLQGSTVSGMLDAWAMAFSNALQHGTPLEDLVRLHEGTRFEPSGMTGNPDIPVASSIPDYVVRLLELKYLKKQDKTNKASGRSGQLCPDCGTELVLQAGCLSCVKSGCGFQRCG